MTRQQNYIVFTYPVEPLYNAMATLGTEESGHRREVETTVNVRTICQKSGSFVEVGFDCISNGVSGYVALSFTKSTDSLAMSQ